MTIYFLVCCPGTCPYVHSKSTVYGRVACADCGLHETEVIMAAREAFVPARRIADVRGGYYAMLFRYSFDKLLELFSDVHQSDSELSVWVWYTTIKGVLGWSKLTTEEGDEWDISDAAFDMVSSALAGTQAESIFLEWFNEIGEAAIAKGPVGLCRTYERWEECAADVRTKLAEIRTREEGKRDSGNKRKRPL